MWNASHIKLSFLNPCPQPTFKAVSLGVNLATSPCGYGNKVAFHSLHLLSLHTVSSPACTGSQLLNCLLLWERVRCSASTKGLRVNSIKSPPWAAFPYSQPLQHPACMDHNGPHYRWSIPLTEEVPGQEGVMTGDMKQEAKEHPPHPSPCSMQDVLCSRQGSDKESQHGPMFPAAQSHPWVAGVRGVSWMRALDPSAKVGYVELPGCWGHRPQWACWNCSRDCNILSRLQDINLLCVLALPTLIIMSLHAIYSLMGNNTDINGPECSALLGFGVCFRGNMMARVWKAFQNLPSGVFALLKNVPRTSGRLASGAPRRSCEYTWSDYTCGVTETDAYGYFPTLEETLPSGFGLKSR